MIRHIVLFKLKEFSSDSERNEALQRVLITFRSLIGQIPYIRQFRVELDSVQGQSSCDVILDSVFDNMEDLKAYQAHPAHLEAIEMNKQWSERKISGDYLL